MNTESCTELQAFWITRCVNCNVSTIIVVSLLQFFSLCSLKRQNGNLCAGHRVLCCHICFHTAVPRPEPRTLLPSWALLRHSAVCPQAGYPAHTRQMVPDRGDGGDGLWERKWREVSNGSCGRKETCEAEEEKGKLDRSF